jgi:YesN/AraC family two-component response regulator
MVSIRCKNVVKSILTDIGVQFGIIELGKVEIMDTINPHQYILLKKALLTHGLQILEEKNSILVEKIKNLIVNLIHTNSENLTIKTSIYLSKTLQLHYNYLSNIFSTTTGISIEQFIIYHKIEKVKELLFYNELNLKQIAALLHYSSVGHLSNQFKKTTGLRPSYFKKLQITRITNLENI